MRLGYLLKHLKQKYLVALFYILAWWLKISQKLLTEETIEGPYQRLIAVDKGVRFFSFRVTSFCL